MKRGCKSARTWARSGRKPFLRPLKVSCGKREIISTATRTAFRGTTARRAFASEAVAVRTVENCFQPELRVFRTLRASTLPPAPTSRMAKSCFWEEAADEPLPTGLEEEGAAEGETNTEKSYLLPFSTTMPSQPSFHRVS